MDKFSKRSEKTERVNIMTNGDRIRNMTDEELAHYITSRELHVCKSFAKFIFVGTAPDQEAVKLELFLSSEFDPDVFRKMGL